MKTRPDKSTVIDGLSVGTIKVMAENSVNITHHIFQKIWENETGHNDWTDSVLIPSQKKGGSKQKCKLIALLMQVK